MKATITASGRVVEALGDPAAEARILNTPLRALIEEAIRAAGLTLVEKPPEDGPYLAISDRTWITEHALRAFLSTAKEPARMRVEDALFLEVTAPLQQLDAPGVFEVGLFPSGSAPDYRALPPVTVDLRITPVPPPLQHAAFKHATPPALPISAAMVHQVDHWSHILRANWLALGALAASQRRKFMAAPLPVKLWRIVRLLLKARSLRRDRLAMALTRVGENCAIHPTAIVEASVLGDNVKIGPHAVVRGVVLGNDVVIEEHAVVKASVLGKGCRVGVRAMANLLVAYDGAWFGAGNGYQATLLGRDVFMAMATSIFDLSFKEPVKVTMNGQRVSSGTWFLGAVIGHEARIGGLVTLGFGAEVPNRAVLLAPIDDVMRKWEPGEGPHRIVDGIARPIVSR